MAVDSREFLPAMLFRSSSLIAVANMPLANHHRLITDRPQRIREGGTILCKVSRIPWSIVSIDHHPDSSLMRPKARQQ
jgi:hypothetical protein